MDIPGYPDRYQVNLPANDPNASTLGLSFLGSDVILDLELSALEADGEGEVISTPRVITANQAEAFIQQGVEIPYQQASSSGATNVQFKEAVLELKVVPLITPDQRIQMDLEVRQDTVGEIFTGALGAEIPSIDTRELQTTVLVGNGDTVVLGGIFQDENNSREEKVPWLGVHQIWAFLPLAGLQLRHLGPRTLQGRQGPAQHAALQQQEQRPLSALRWSRPQAAAAPVRPPTRPGAG